MKINGNDPIIDIQLQNPERERRQAPQLEKRPEPQDRLEFSTSSRAVESYRRVETPELRAERVAEISRQVQAGTYNIKAEKVAEAIISGAIFDEKA